MGIWHDAGIINNSAKLLGPGAWPGPGAGGIPPRERLSPAGRRAASEARPGCCAQRLCQRLFCLISLQEQRLRDPSHPHTWLPPSLLPPSPRGFPGGGAGEKGLGKGGSQNPLAPLISPPGRGKLLPQRQG